MNNNFEELEDIFAGIEKDVSPKSELKTTEDIIKIPDGFTQTIKPLNQNLINYYVANPSLLESDIEAGIITQDVASDLRTAVFAYPDINKENPELNTESKGKQKLLNNNVKKVMHEPYDLGFAETLLLGLVVSSVGLVYLGYLYLVI